jgi:peptidoglycan hydrolase-like amidase
MHGIIKSLCFTTKKHEGTISIQGRGIGHHIGLCQWGAREWYVMDGITSVFYRFTIRAHI